VFEKDVASKYSLPLSQLEYTRLPRASGKPPRASTTGSYLSLFSRRTRNASAALHRTQKKRFSFSRSLAYSSCWAGFSFSTSCFTIPIHPSQFHRCL